MFSHDSQPQTVSVPPQRATLKSDEGWARLQGLMSQLALPERRGLDGKWRKPKVEILIKSDEWVKVDGLVIESNKVTFRHGYNGKAVHFEYLEDETLPEWRIDKNDEVVIILGNEVQP